ncbi:hypothetical protein KY897_004208 [Vibrio vulnificus]|nr:hypothetical protein [Vibrio vulnificus]
MQRLLKRRIIVIPVSVVIIILLMVFFIYRSEFKGGFSGTASDWGSFGSYFGGVAGPIVGLFSLVAVLITIKLQATLIDSQRSEFIKLHKLQSDTLEQTRIQVDLQKDSLEQTREQVALQFTQMESESMARERENCLSVIDSYLNLQDIYLDLKVEKNNMDIKVCEIEQLTGDNAGYPDNHFEVKKATLQNELLNYKALHASTNQKLHLLKADILASQFETANELRIFFGKKAKEILHSGNAV